MNTVELKCGSYEVLRVLKQTRDKSISLARNVLTGEKVILRTQVQDSQAYMLLSLVRNEHLAKVFWVQNCGDAVYIVEEYIDGVLLSDVVREKVLPRREVLRIGLQLCNALRALHSAGIVYRDLKPENLFLMEDGSIKLFDYDAARVYKSYAGEDTTPLGTVGFAAPEQFGLMQSDARSDIYSLGILLNILLTGVHPALRLCRGRLRRVILRCTNVNPERRYQTVEEVGRTLIALRCGADRIAAVCIAAGLIAGLCLWLTQLLPVQGSESTVLPDTTQTENSALPVSTPQSAAAEKASLRMPMSFSERIESVQQYTLGDTVYHLIISTNPNEMDAPELEAKTRHRYVAEHEIMPVYVYVVPVQGGADKIREFKEQVREVRYEFSTPGGAQVPFTLRNYAMSLYSDTNVLAFGELIAQASDGSCEPQHSMISAWVRMQDGVTLTLNLSMTQTPANIVLSHEDYAMDTADELNRLLNDLELAYGWDHNVTVTLQLPETVYTEQIVIKGRAVTLQGAQAGTVFAEGLRITSSDAAQITLRDISFRGNGTGAAITSARDTVAIGCSFEAYDTAWRPMDGAQFSCYDSTFRVTIPPEQD